MLAVTPSGSRWFNPTLYALLVLCISQTYGLDISYCSPQNNAGLFPVYTYQFQSNGECQDHCQGSYAFAVLQGNDCWCSNYIPEGQVSTSECDQECPGFPDEQCGSTEAGLYGYYLLSLGVPLGTSSGSTAVSKTTSSGSARTTFDSSTITSTSPGGSSSPTEVYTSVTTVTGEVRTIIVTPTASGSADAALGQTSSGAGGANTGKIVGIVLGVVLGISAIIGVAIWLLFRRRRQNRELAAGSDSTFVVRTGDSSPSNNLPSRQVSQMSSSGLLGTKAPRINTLGIPQGNDLRNVETASSGYDRRSLGTDQRLNPYALYIHDESRLSDVSLQDNQDYSRQLRVANPDP